MSQLLSWIESLSYMDALFYWAVLLFLDFVIVDRVWSKGSFRSNRLSLNFWMPFGVFVPVFWLLRLPDPIVIDLLVAGVMVLFYGPVRPLLYRKKYANKL